MTTYSKDSFQFKELGINEAEYLDEAVYKQYKCKSYVVIKGAYKKDTESNIYMYSFYKDGFYLYSSVSDENTSPKCKLIEFIADKAMKKLTRKTRETMQFINKMRDEIR